MTRFTNGFTILLLFFSDGTQVLAPTDNLTQNLIGMTSPIQQIVPATVESSQSTSQPGNQGQPTASNTPQTRKLYLDLYIVNFAIQNAVN